MAATYDLISSQTINTNTCTFSSITGSYTDLLIQASYTMSAGGDTYLRFNSDSSSVYQFLGAGSRNDGTQIFEVVNSGGNTTFANFNGSPNSQQQTDNPATVEFFIPQYADSTYVKAGMVCTSLITSRSAPRNNTSVIAWRWNVTSAITQIDINASSGNLVGTFNLYGILAANA